MSQTTTIPANVAALADKLDNVVRLTAVAPLTVPALAVLLGRYIAYEAGSAETPRINEGVLLCLQMALAAAIEEANRLYGPRNS